MAISIQLPANGEGVEATRGSSGAGGAVCQVSGELDVDHAHELRATLHALPAAVHAVIDLRGVTFIDSAGLGALVGGVRKIRDGGGTVVAVCDRPSVLRVLRITGFDRLVPTIPEPDAPARLRLLR